MSETTIKMPAGLRQWVANWWADRMKSENAPDLPDEISVEQFEAASKALANRIDPWKKPA